MPECGEQQLLKQARDGDRGAFDRLRALLEPRVRRFIYRLVGTSSAAEDIVQDAFLALYLNLARIDPPEKRKTAMIETADDPIITLTREMNDIWRTKETTMAQTSDDQLRSLIRLIPPARALRDDLERSLHLENYMGTGDLAVRSFQGLQASVAGIMNDPYLASLSISVPEGANDMEKVSLVRLAAGQLVAYLEGQTGLSASAGGSSSGGNGGNINIQKAPTVNFAAINGVDSATLSKMIELGGEALKAKGEEEEAKPAP